MLVEVNEVGRKELK